MVSDVVLSRSQLKVDQPTVRKFVERVLSKSLTEAKYAADHSYVGIVADARGKRIQP